MVSESNCVFCNTKSQTQASRQRDGAVFECPVCGVYEVTGMELHTIRDKKFSVAQRLHCIATNIHDSESGLTPIWNSKPNNESLSKGLIFRDVDDYKGQPILHADKPDEILRLLASKLRDLSPFERVPFTPREVFSLKIDGFKELRAWLGVLFENGLIECEQFKALQNNSQRIQFDISGYKYGLAPTGWTRVEQLFHNIHSKKAFIAMSFGHPERQEIQKAIEVACAQTGWEAFTIDKKEYVGGISDEIIASINQSGFVVAEFTGDNQGVYYEAGYAIGKGIPVIMAVKESQIHDNPRGIHFDTRHINHIAWENYEDFTGKLKNRILAIIPRG